MTIHINLLPHREERRKRARQHFFALGGLTALLGLAIVGAGHVYYSNRIAVQKDRNSFLKGQLSQLDKQIDEIRKLKAEIQALLARKQVIETLQADRAQTVHLMDELVRVVPEGVYLKSVKQHGLKVALTGYAMSNARVSTLMRNIDASPWLEKAHLVEIKATTVAKRRLSEFHLNMALKRPQEPGANKKGAKAGSKAGKR